MPLALLILFCLLGLCVVWAGLMRVVNAQNQADKREMEADRHRLHMVRGCHGCKHFDVEGDEEPCLSCSLTSNFAYWEEHEH